MSEIDRVQPIEGAQVVRFDYGAAEDALAAVRHTLPEILGGQGRPRASAGTDASTDWAGHFRDEFDRAEESLLTRISDGAAWGSVVPAGDIVAAAGRANDRQREYNEARLRAIEEEERDRDQEPVPNGSGPR